MVRNLVVLALGMIGFAKKITARDGREQPGLIKLGVLTYL